MITDFIVRLASVLVAGTALGAFTAGAASYLHHRGEPSYREEAILWGQDAGYAFGAVAVSMLVFEYVFM